MKMCTFLAEDLGRNRNLAFPRIAFLPTNILVNDHIIIIVLLHLKIINVALDFKDQN